MSGSFLYPNRLEREAMILSSFAGTIMVRVIKCSAVMLFDWLVSNLCIVCLLQNSLPVEEILALYSSKPAASFPNKESKVQEKPNSMKRVCCTINMLWCLSTTGLHCVSIHSLLPSVRHARLLQSRRPLQEAQWVCLLFTIIWWSGCLFKLPHKRLQSFMSWMFHVLFCFRSLQEMKTFHVVCLMCNSSLTKQIFNEPQRQLSLL